MSVTKIVHPVQDNKNSIALNVLTEKKSFYQVAARTLSTVSTLALQKLTKTNEILAIHAIQAVSLVRDHKTIIALLAKKAKKKTEQAVQKIQYTALMHAQLEHSKISEAFVCPVIQSAFLAQHHKVTIAQNVQTRRKKMLRAY